MARSSISSVWTGPAATPRSMRSSTDLAELAAEIRGRRPSSEPYIGVGVAIVGVVRRSDGFVSMAPNLGWRDVPLDERLALALDTAAPISVANDADLGALAEVRRGAAIGAEDVLFIHGEVGVGGGLILGGKPLTGVAGYGGEVGHIPVNPNGSPVAADRWAAGRPRSARAPCSCAAGHPPGGGRLEVAAVLREAEAGAPEALARSTGRPLARLRPGRPRQHLQSTLVVLGGLFGRIHPFVARTIAGGARPAGPAGAPRPRPRRPGIARRGRAIARRGRARVRAAPGGSGDLAAAALGPDRAGERLTMHGRRRDRPGPCGRVNQAHRRAAPVASPG